MNGQTMSRKQFEAMIEMLREGYEAGAFRGVEIQYPGVSTDCYPRMQANILYSSRPSQSALEWITGTFAKIRTILSGDQAGQSPA